MFDELDAEVARFLSAPKFERAPPAQVVSSPPPDAHGAWRDQLQGKTQPNAIQVYTATQEQLQAELLNKSLKTNEPTNRRPRQQAPAQLAEKSQTLIKEKRRRRREEFQSTLKNSMSEGTMIPHRHVMDRSLTHGIVGTECDVDDTKPSKDQYNLEDSSHFRVNKALRAQIAANRKQHTEIRRLMSHVVAERERLNGDKIDLSFRLDKLNRQKELNEQRSELRETRPESHKNKDKVQEALEAELALLNAGADKLEDQIDTVVDMLEAMDRAINASKEMIQDKQVAMELDNTVLSALNARTDHLSVGCGRTSAGFKRNKGRLKVPTLLTEAIPEIKPLLNVSVDSRENKEEVSGEKAKSPESNIHVSPKAKASLLPVDSWEKTFERLAKRCKDLVTQACQARVNIKNTCQSLGDFCANADLQKASKEVSFQFREHLRTEKLIIENVEAELKDLKVIKRAEKAEVRVARVLREKRASIKVFEERVTVRLANRPPGESTSDRASVEIRNAITEMREEARDLNAELEKIKKDLEHLRKEKTDTEEHIKDKRIAVKIDTKAFLLGEKKAAKPKIAEKTEGDEAEEADAGKKKSRRKNIWTFYY